MFCHPSRSARPITVHERMIYQDYFPQSVLSNVRIVEGKVPFWLLASMAGMALGNYIYFRKSVYQPNTPAGVELLGHELTHVAQYCDGMSLWKYLWASRHGYRKNPYEIEAYAQGANIKNAYISKV